ncbi:hypothetical protein EVAR_46864_1 [Eumeta japonica]|uniref:Uncharacterized protein n=1 Tax=Eumeta variegata TaxID=151549 RepID=A0A4C1XPJ3_EUMVA|nr:hypothetical protein EVAR_46864_1 [Eumeta japonica]
MQTRTYTPPDIYSLRCIGTCPFQSLRLAEGRAMMVMTMMKIRTVFIQIIVFKKPKTKLIPIAFNFSQNLGYDKYDWVTRMLKLGTLILQAIILDKFEDEQKQLVSLKMVAISNFESVPE